MQTGICFENQADPIGEKTMTRGIEFALQQTYDQNHLQQITRLLATCEDKNSLLCPTCSKPIQVHREVELNRCDKELSQ